MNEKKKPREDVAIRMDREFVNELVKDYHESTGIMMGEREILTHYAMLGLKTVKEQKEMGNLFKQGLGGMFGGK